MLKKIIVLTVITLLTLNTNFSHAAKMDGSSIRDTGEIITDTIIEGNGNKNLLFTTGNLQTDYEIMIRNYRTMVPVSFLWII